MSTHRLVQYMFVLLPALMPTRLVAQQRHPFGIAGDKFEMDGNPFQVISGEMHNPRIPRVRWEHDLRTARAMGLNTVTIYTFWNAHEGVKGQYDGLCCINPHVVVWSR